MERLTERFSNGQAAVAGCGKNCKYEFRYCTGVDDGNCPTLSEIYEKLAAYEEREMNQTKKAILVIDVPTDFEEGQCYECPISFIDDEHNVCCPLRSSLNCPIMNIEQ